MQRRYLWLVLGAVIAGMSLAAAGSAAVSTQGGVSPKAASVRQAGTVVFGAEQEPPCLNVELAGCNNTWTSWTAGIALPGAYRVRPDFTFEPYMIDGEAKTTTKPFTVTYKIKQKATWSDGKPVTADDFIYTWRFHLDKKVDVAGRSGYDSIARGQKLSAKTVKFTYKKPYAGWKTLFGTIYPQHVLQGTDLNEVWNNNYNDPKTGKSIGSGPFIIGSYVKGQSITMVRNPRYWGKRPALDRIVFRFVTNTDSEVQAIRGGEVDAIYPQPQLQLAQLKGQSGLKVESNAGTTLEHIDFNTGKKANMPLIGAPWFRQAVAYSLDRKALVTQLFKTLNPKLPVAQNLTYTPTQKQYVPHFQRYTYQPDKVTSIMQAHGCRKGGDGIYSCNGIRASVKFGTTAGNKLRELALEIMQAQAKRSGIEFVPDSQPSRLFFPRVSDENYQMALFAWVTTGDPAGQTDIYGCGGESNWKGYCSRKVTNLLKGSDAELNPTRRAALVNGADANLSLNVPTLPLYQKPTYFAYKTKLKGLKDNPTLQGPTWNVEDWSTG